MGLSVLGDYVLTKILNMCKVKSSAKVSVITKVAGLAATLAAGIFSAQISKHASRVGRFKVKQELLKNPEQLTYVSDDKTGEIKDVQIPPSLKTGIFSFLMRAYKDNKEYNRYKKTGAIAEKRFFKAVESLELTPEQIKDAKRLQKNTFKTFNKVDENSQKYSESVEALGQAAYTPLGVIFALVGATLGLKYLNKIFAAKTNITKIIKNIKNTINNVLIGIL